jgi:aryl-alcohol dehydrogenase-like predicted oxidoreductase
MTAPIVGANTPEQLDPSLRALELAIPDELLARLDQASAWE